jgi:hypothetical protein
MVMTTTTSRAWVMYYWLSCVVLSAQSFVPGATTGRWGSILSAQSFVETSGRKASRPLSRPGQALYAFYDETGSGPSDSAYSADLQDKKTVAFDEKEEDDKIRDALKRELLLFSSVTNRGEYATPDEQVSIVSFSDVFGDAYFYRCSHFSSCTAKEYLGRSRKSVGSS